MKIQAKDLKAGQTFSSFGVTYVAHDVTVEKGSVYVIVDPSCAFISSSFCAFAASDMIEVL